MQVAGAPFRSSAGSSVRGTREAGVPAKNSRCEREAIEMPVDLPVRRKRRLSYDTFAICALGLLLIAAVLAPEFLPRSDQQDSPQASADLR